MKPTSLFFACMLFVSCGKNATSDSDKPGLERKDGMVKIQGGTTMMGSEGVFETPYGHKEFPEEVPTRKIQVTGFWIDETEVTNDEFAKFVEETGYVTYAERVANIEDFPPEARAQLPSTPFKNGSIVFTPPASFDGDLNNHFAWWRWDQEANWRHPLGKDSNIKDKGNHPVVCVTIDDAKAYAKWAGKRIPTEAEWEYAARGGLKGKMYSWGDELKPDNKWMANTFQGEFPKHDSGDDGFVGSSPVKSYASNGYGLYDMAGNAWEICSDYYDPEYRSTCESCDPKGPSTWINRLSNGESAGAPHHVTKGGSFLCHVSYCMRYRPASRHSQEADSPSNHTGFRCVRDLNEEKEPKP